MYPWLFTSSALLVAICIVVVVVCGVLFGFLVGVAGQYVWKMLIRKKNQAGAT